ncbi:MAG: M48 family metalloprotease [Methanomassiliicoccaceae archaeon]|jgi:heat shock protein HtpX|nr:M48 family metalloprotease [Methanomassiliicoccaceae archaeon]
MGYIVRTAALFLVLMLIFMGIGYVLWYFLFDPDDTNSLLLIMGAFIALTAMINLFSYFFSKKIVLKAHKVKIITRADNPRLYGIVEGIATSARLPMPQVGITHNPTPNAFATGRNPKNAAVVATSGLLELLDDKELRGVMAHEMAHVKNRDILVMSVAATVAGAISIMARFALFSTFRSRDNGAIIVMLLAYLTIPLAALLIQLGISRGREYKADEAGAKIINDPLALASALDKLENGNRREPMLRENPSSAHMWIANPFGGKKGMTSMFSTHPPMEERIRRLNKMAGRIQ